MAVVLPVRQRTAEWLAARENGIGASQAAAALGLDPWQSPIGLWAEKLGLVPPAAENVSMQIGNALEPLIAQLYTEATGIKVRRANNLRQHPAHAFMLASLDRRAGRKPIELKFSARAAGYGEPGTDEVPEHVLVQVLHQLAVLDEPEGDVALLRPGADQVAIYPISRDATAEALIVERESVLWDHVLSRTEPPVDGSEATRHTLNALYQRVDELVIDADPATAAAMNGLRVVRREIDDDTAVREQLEAEIKAAMLAARATVIRAAGVGQITWRQPKDSTKTDWRLVAQGYRRLLDADSFDRSEIEAIESLYTETKENTPRFTPKWEQEEETDG